MSSTATLEKEDINVRLNQEAGYYSGLKFGFTENPSDLLKAWIQAEVEALEGRE
jgi:hypothetical protein